MRKNHTKIMGGAMVISLVLTSAVPNALVKAAPGEATRVGEVDSYATAAKVATLNWTNPKDVVLVCGEGFADAVSATVLAKQLDAPILLTTAASLNNSAKEALDILKPKNVYVIGGNASVSKVVRDGLRESNYNLVELGGQDRYQTNIAVANQLIKLGVDPNNVMLVSGEGFSDTLSVTSVAAAKDQILLLGTNSNSSMKPVLDFVKANNSKVTVVGTRYSINDNMYKSLGAIKRVDGGLDRFETNLKVLSEFDGELKSEKLFIANASGNRYADALIASSLAGKWKAPLVLVDSEDSPSTDKAMSYIKGKANSSIDLNVIGNSEAVSGNVVSKINSTVPKLDSPTVKSVSTNGLNQIKVEFNTEVDKNTSEMLRSYEIDGANLGSTAQLISSATLQDDRRTVLITLSNPYQQYQDVNFKVKNVILDKTQTDTIVQFEQKITFSDVTPPTLESVTSSGGNKLTVKFSEPIRIDINNLAAMKINRQSVFNFALNKSISALKEQSGVWADRVELYFDSPLPEGSNTFTMPSGISGKKYDNAAGFPIKETSVTFNVSAISGLPQVSSVIGDATGTIYIRYNRAMDKQTALDDTNYKINGSTVNVSSDDIGFDEGSNDTIVKIKDIGYLLKEGNNEVIVRDDVKDTYGNNISESSFSFSISNDAVKPQVTNVSIVDGKTLRVKFNKDVLNSHATDKSNYKITDSEGTEINNQIDDIYSVTIDGNSKRTFDIKFKDRDALKGTKYTLTVRNITDTNSKPNVMDTYTTVISGLDDERPSVTAVVRKADNDQQVVIFFSKEMDQASITDPNNYFFINGKGETVKLPSSADIIPGMDYKSVIIDFPTNYSIDDGTDERYVIKIGVANVRDSGGKTLETLAYSGAISTSYSGGPGLVDDTAKLTFDGDNIKVRFLLTAPLDILNVNDFRVNGKTPDNATMVGKEVILTYKSGIKNNEKIDAIKSAGDTTTLSISGTSSVDAAGRQIRYGSDTIWLPPTTDGNAWIANSNRSSGGNSSVTVVFNQTIDDDIRASYSDDFTFTNQRTGEKLEVLSVSVDRRNIIYKFNSGAIQLGDKIEVKANSDSSKINIRNDRNSNEDYSVYSPSRDDLIGRTITAR